MTAPAATLKLVEAPPAAARRTIAPAVPNVLALPVPKPKLPARMVRRIGRGLANAVPALIVVALLLLFWELASAGPKASLPPPSKIWTESKDLILQPFFVNGPQDIGLGWRVLTSPRQPDHCV